MLVFEKLNPKTHDRIKFSCGVPVLDTYLQRYASQNYRDGDSTTHVVVDTEDRSRILGYVTLSTASLNLAQINCEELHKFRRNPVPAIRVCRLAVSTEHQNRKIGSSLLGYAVLKSRSLRDIAGVRVLLVDAKNEQVACFYKRFGFKPTVLAPLVLYYVL